MSPNTAPGISLLRGGESLHGGPPRHVCHIAYTFYENDKRVIRYVDALTDAGYRVDVIALRRPRQGFLENAGPARIFRIQRRTKTEARARSYFAKVLWFFVQATCLVSALQLRRRYDVVHVHNMPDFLVFSALLPKLMGARVILDIHDVVPELYAGKFNEGDASRVVRLLKRVERMSCRFSDHVIVSNHIWLDKICGRSASRDCCSAMLNYPDLDLFRPTLKSAEASKQRYIVLYPGTLNHHQGLDVALRAFAKAKERMPDADFHIYGEGPAWKDLERLIVEMGLCGRVFMKPAVPLTAIAGIMANADVGVVPKRADGFGNEAFSTKILEFMACGVPVIVSRTKVDAYYFDSTLVRFFAPGDEDDLARALIDIYRARAMHSGWVARAADFAARNSWQSHQPEYLGLIEGFSRTPPPAPAVPTSD